MSANIRSSSARGLAVAGILILASSSAPAGTPDPHRSVVGLSPPSAPCQYRFRADGAFPLTLYITVRDAFDTPVPDLDVDVTAAPGAGTVFCSCESLVQGGVTDGVGAVPLAFSRIGGHGTLDLAVTARPLAGMLEIWTGSVEFTTPDLNGSCEAMSSTNIFDLGFWAGGLPPGYQIQSDYDCNGVVDVFDLGVLAGGLGLGCSP
jgi:hypothetical protein